MSLSIIPLHLASFLGGIGTGEIIVILVLFVVIFGATKLPQIGEALGKGIRNFKKSVKGEDDEESAPKELPASNHKAIEGSTAAPAEEAKSPAMEAEKR